ncbi:unnamed protein product [Paramecium sonneborni]|uniref:Uncharacterized protein n=1 Tax=Paramecium sonneborni TaxID=65129 RepID=A0A8S1QI52_9CILI|nr:unnamed protein product [Paramecium sonneborni]
MSKNKYRILYIERIFKFHQYLRQCKSNQRKTLHTQYFFKTLKKRNWEKEPMVRAYEKRRGKRWFKETQT